MAYKNWEELEDTLRIIALKMVDEYLGETYHYFNFDDDEIPKTKRDLRKDFILYFHEIQKNLDKEIKYFQMIKRHPINFELPNMNFDIIFDENFLSEDCKNLLSMMVYNVDYKPSEIVKLMFYETHIGEEEVNWVGKLLNTLIKKGYVNYEFGFFYKPRRL